MHAADRHVERWAPEATAQRSRPLRSLGFVDRLIAPWVETAQRSQSLRMFGHYASTGFAERAPLASTSWLFPRPWYQDELDWMAAARAPSADVGPAVQPSTQVAEQMADHYTRVAEVQRITQQVAARELAAETRTNEQRIAASLPPATPSTPSSATPSAPIAPTAQP